MFGNTTHRHTKEFQVSKAGDLVPGIQQHLL